MGNNLEYILASASAKYEEIDSKMASVNDLGETRIKCKTLEQEIERLKSENEDISGKLEKVNQQLQVNYKCDIMLEGTWALRQYIR